MRDQDRFPTGVFTVSLDFELLWGTIDRSSRNSFRRLCAEERATIVDGLLDLFREFRLPATWCVVGQLFLDPEAAIAARRRLRSGARSNDSRLGDFSGLAKEELYARDLVRRIYDCPVPQEIGGHGFTHLPFTDPMCTAEAAAAELAQLQASARSMNLVLKSFAFPRNRVAHTALLAKFGYAIFRCQDASWHHQTNRRGWKHRLGHAWDIVRAAPPPVVMPARHPDGLWQVPGSMLFTPARGVRSAIPVARRVERAVKGLEAAAESGRVFHLWFHPTDLAPKSAEMLGGLRQILQCARHLRDEGKLQFMSMQSLAQMAAVFSQESQPVLAAAAGRSE
ncbi:MAG TPA: hypothetical protein VKX39_13940 [Bryobacteraceae bacterium]|nr:hypothetical protein [Bryobacteraceae bacterium]